MDKRTTKPGYRLVLQDTGDPLTRTVDHMTREKLIANSLGPIEGLDFDCYAHCVNHASGVYHKSDVRERTMEFIPRLRSGSALQMKQAFEQLDQQNVDILQTYCEAAHAQGKSCMLRLRMQDLHDRMGIHMEIDRNFASVPTVSVPEPYYYMAKWKRDHPEYLMGNPFAETPTDQPRFWRNIATNYALGPVIEYHFSLAQELIDRYDMDTLELDFMRFAFYFHEHEAYVQRHVLTQLIRRIRQCVDKRNAGRDKPLCLTARVPDTVELGLRNGIDVPVWLAEGLLDGITISGGYSPFGTPWRELVQLAAKAGLPALACLSSGGLGRDIEVIRAAAARAISHGCCGIELWNYFYCMDFYHRPGKNPLPLSEFAILADHQALMRSAKRYELKLAESNSIVGAAHAHAAWPGQLPMTIGVGGEHKHLVEFDVADDPKVHKDAVWTVDLHLLDIGREDELAFTWNGQAVDKGQQSWWSNSVHDRHYLQFNVSAGSCVRGVNVLGGALLKRDAGLDPFVTLGGASLSIPESVG